MWIGNFRLALWGATRSAKRHLWTQQLTKARISRRGIQFSSKKCKIGRTEVNTREKRTQTCSIRTKLYRKNLVEKMLYMEKHKFFVCFSYIKLFFFYNPCFSCKVFVLVVSSCFVFSICFFSKTRLKTCKIGRTEVNKREKRTQTCSNTNRTNLWDRYRDKKINRHCEYKIYRVDMFLNFLLLLFNHFSICLRFSDGFWRFYEGPGRFRVEFPQHVTRIRPPETSKPPVRSLPYMYIYIYIFFFFFFLNLLHPV